MEGGDGLEEVDGRVTQGMVAMDVEELAAEQSRQWKGISSTSMVVEPQERKEEGFGAQTSEDVGWRSSKRRIWRDMVYSRGGGSGRSTGHRAQSP